MDAAIVCASERWAAWQQSRVTLPILFSAPPYADTVPRAWKVPQLTLKTGSGGVLVTQHLWRDAYWAISSITTICERGCCVNGFDKACTWQEIRKSTNCLRLLHLLYYSLPYLTQFIVFSQHRDHFTLLASKQECFGFSSLFSCFWVQEESFMQAKVNNWLIIYDIHKNNSAQQISVSVVQISIKIVYSYVISIAQESYFLFIRYSMERLRGHITASIGELLVI